MSSLGYRLVHSLFASRRGTMCERAFFSRGSRGESSPRTLETGRDLAQFDAIAFSISYENDLPGIVGALSTSGIPPLREERGPDSPLVVAGGALTLMNPEPLSPVVDIFLVGEGEVLIPFFLDALEEVREEPDWKSLLLARLEGKDGVYVPRSEFPGRARALARVYLGEFRDLEREESQALGPCAHFGDVYLLEVGRGCPRSCRFCVARTVYHPVRFRAPSSIDSEIRRARPKADRVGFLGASLSDYRHLESSLRVAASLGLTVQTSSLRMDRLSEGLLDVLASCGVRTLTTAPEAGTERMRKVIRKDLSGERILGAARMIGRAGFPQLRLYFMVGLPGERDEDVRAIADLTLTIAREVRSAGAGTRITLCLSPFVPKPWTPFQWAPYERPETLRRKIQDVVHRVRGRVSVKSESVAASTYEALITRGDREVGTALARAVFEERPVSSLLKERRISKEWYLHREREREEYFPWDFLDHGVSKERLWEEWAEAKAAASR